MKIINPRPTKLGTLRIGSRILVHEPSRKCSMLKFENYCTRVNGKAQMEIYVSTTTIP